MWYTFGQMQRRFHHSTISETDFRPVLPNRQNRHLRDFGKLTTPEARSNENRYILRGCVRSNCPLHHDLFACRISGRYLKISDGRIFLPIFPAGARPAPVKNTDGRREKTSDRKNTKFAEGRACRLLVPTVQKNQ